MAIGFRAGGVARAARSTKDGGATKAPDLYELANLFPEDTGLPVTVWVSPRGRARHAARVKVCRVPGNKMVPSDIAVVRIEPEPQLIDGDLDRRYLDPVLRWVGANRGALLRYWNGEIGTGRLMQELRPLGR